MGAVGLLALLLLAEERTQAVLRVLQRHRGQLAFEVHRAQLRREERALCVAEFDGEGEFVVAELIH
jgi:hypothetical protein